MPTWVSVFGRVTLKAFYCLSFLLFVITEMPVQSAWHKLNLVILFCMGFYVSLSVAHTDQFFLISDLHYDPWYNENYNPSTFCRGDAYIETNITECRSVHKLHTWNTKYGQWHCDTPFSLMTSAYQAMKKTQPNPDFIIM
jgi:hypothetical protein